MKTIILIAGKARSGKDTCAKILAETFDGEILHFAKKVKKFCYKDFKELINFLNEIFRKAIEISKSNKDILFFKNLITEKKHFTTKNKTRISRLLLQIYGTDIFRKRVDEDFWIKITEKDIEKSRKDIIIIPDARFINELEYFDNKYKTIKILIERENMIIENKHISENEFLKYNKFDYKIKNNSTLDKYIKQCMKLSEKIKEKL